VVDDDAAVSEVANEVVVRRGVQVHVGRLVRGLPGGDGSVLAGQVADLAGFRRRLFARRLLSALVRVQMRLSRCAIAVGRDGFSVEVVGCGNEMLALVRVVW
jgi:hypothetical protein